jgi:hypothetical protein
MEEISFTKLREILKEDKLGIESTITIENARLCAVTKIGNQRFVSEYEGKLTISRDWGTHYYVRGDPTPQGRFEYSFPQFYATDEGRETLARGSTPTANVEVQLESAGPGMKIFYE